MPRYFFHIWENNEFSRDSEGQEFDDLEAARKDAVSASREMVSERLLHGGDINHRRIEITDGEGQMLAEVHARDVLMRDGQTQRYDNDAAKSAPVADLGAFDGDGTTTPPPSGGDGARRKS